VSLADELRKQGKAIVTTNGCFDLLHVGHVRILKEARELGDVLIVGLNSDNSVKKLKGPSRPITPQAERAEILSSLAAVDYVTIFDEDTPIEFLKLVKPVFHVKGSDYQPADLEETPVVEEFGGEVKILQLVPERSTTSLLSRIGSQS
jgi:glycerol-3-phosphate cytidylyltransferase